MEEAEALTARSIGEPYKSEHNLGLAVDFNDVNYAFENEKAFTWLMENAEKYGFILRYPARLKQEEEKRKQVEHQNYVNNISNVYARQYTNVQREAEKNKAINKQFKKEYNKELRKLRLQGFTKAGRVMWYQKADNLPCEPSYLCHPAGSSGSCDYNSPEAARTYFRKDHTDLFGGTFQHHCA